MTFGERLKELRKLTKSPQKNIAEYLGITIRAYQFYEADQKEPSINGLKKLADYFNVPLDFLVGRGVFENWGQISSHWDIVSNMICLQLSKTFPQFTQQFENIKENKIYAIQIINIFISKILIDDNNNITVFLEKP